MIARHAARLCLVAAGMAGCATITKGTTQPVIVDTPGAAGAVCELTSGKIGVVKVTTPGSVVLKRSGQAIQVRCTKACYQDGIGVIDSNIEANVAGNIILGGVLGAGIDAATGAASKYDSSISVIMTPLPGCKA